MINIFKSEPYPRGLQWDDPAYTLYRDFQFSAPECEYLINLVKTHMSDKGNSGETRRKLLAILYNKCSEQFFLVHLRRKYPRTWRIRWKWKKVRESFHRKFKTRKFRRIVQEMQIAKEAMDEILKEDKTNE